MAAEQTIAKERYLFSRVIDFLCLGGASFIIVPSLVFIPKEYYHHLFIAGLILANFINHPHFAHSYQIFYEDFRNKIKGAGYPKPLQYRYIFSGLILPVLLTGFFAYCILHKDVQMLAHTANVMLFLVGWHYVKQGYGILIVDSVYKKLFLSQQEKKVFLINAYAFWLFFWAYTNAFLMKMPNDYWGISYSGLPVPQAVAVGLGMIAAITTAACFAVLARFWIKHKDLPLNGVTAYFASVYVWLWLRNAPLALIFIPAFHSLQYLAVVWRYQLNATEKILPEKKAISNSFRNFVLTGFLLGLMGFWILPFGLSTYASYDRSIFGLTLFVFLFWIFINIHHYFMDNVIWRRENPNTKKYLFG